MSSTATEKTGNSAAPGTAASTVSRRGSEHVAHTGDGQTKIADVVVQKIASLAAREIAGVRQLGGGTARTIGALRGRIPGAGTSHGQGVTVEVGERQVAVDLDLLIDYGVAIPDLSREVRQNVITSIEDMTGLEVVEVNINVVDVYLGDDSDSSDSPSQPQRSRVE